ncbi:rhomboid-like protein [Streptomyces sp. NPDC048442]|uniref:rhomboid-like protein n=1 Tax=Streptomyces sp. NPDC048442 TaxID=3154823 RepID=UPI00342E0FF1
MGPLRPPEAPPEAAPAGRRPLRAAARTTWRYLRSSPGTHLWLAVLFVTTVALRHMDPALADEFLRQRSTNIHHLSQDPVRVLVTSAFWTDGGGWLLYAVLYSLFHAPAERRLGTLRWLGVVAAAHIGATYLSEGVLGWAIRHGHAPASAVNTLDVGVSYALAGVVAVLTYRIPTPWRYPYLFGVLTFYALPLVTGRTFTDVGHFSAVLIGLACYPLTRSRPSGRPARRPPSAPSRSPAP